METGRFVVPFIRRRVFARSLWLNIVRRGEWENEMGPSRNVLFYERSAPTEAQPAWTDIHPSDLVPDGTAGGSCNPATHKIAIASTVRSFNLQRRHLEGPDICNIDLMPKLEMRSQLQNVAEILSDYTKIEWEIRYRHQYFLMCQTKVVVDSCTAPTESTTLATTYPSACPTHPLNMAVVSKYTIDLMRDGAGAEALLRGAGGSPLVTMIVSNETRGNIIRQNSEIREDIRQGNANNLLIRAFGVSHSYGDIVWLVDPFPRRFECSGGTYTQVAPFALGAATTRGQPAIVNTSWKTATNEESFLYDPMVKDCLIPRPPTAPHPLFRFDPLTFTGAVRMLNIQDRQCNPLGNIVFHHMALGAGTAPNETWRGAAFVHLRCDPMGCTTACSS